MSRFTFSSVRGNTTPYSTPFVYAPSWRGWFPSFRTDPRTHSLDRSSDTYERFVHSSLPTQAAPILCLCLRRHTPNHPVLLHTIHERFFRAYCIVLRRLQPLRIVTVHPLSRHSYPGETMTLLWAESSLIIGRQSSLRRCYEARPRSLCTHTGLSPQTTLRFNPVQQPEWVNTKLLTT